MGKIKRYITNILENKRLKKFEIENQKNNSKSNLFTFDNDYTFTNENIIKKLFNIKFKNDSISLLSLTQFDNTITEEFETNYLIEIKINRLIDQVTALKQIVELLLDSVDLKRDLKKN